MKRFRGDSQPCVLVYKGVTGLNANEESTCLVCLRRSSRAMERHVRALIRRGLIDSNAYVIFVAWHGEFTISELNHAVAVLEREENLIEQLNRIAMIPNDASSGKKHMERQNALYEWRREKMDDARNPMKYRKNRNGFVPVTRKPRGERI